MNIPTRTLTRVVIGAAGPVAMAVASTTPAYANQSVTVPGTKCTLSDSNIRSQVFNGNHKITADVTISCPAALSVWVRGDVISGDIDADYVIDGIGQVTATPAFNCAAGYLYQVRVYAVGQVFPGASNEKYTTYYDPTSNQASYTVLC